MWGIRQSRVTSVTNGLSACVIRVNASFVSKKPLLRLADVRHLTASTMLKLGTVLCFRNYAFVWLSSNFMKGMQAYHFTLPNKECALKFHLKSHQQIQLSEVPTSIHDLQWAPFELWFWLQHQKCDPTPFRQWLVWAKYNVMTFTR